MYYFVFSISIVFHVLFMDISYLQVSYSVSYILVYIYSKQFHDIVTYWFTGVDKSHQGISYSDNLYL